MGAVILLSSGSLRAQESTTSTATALEPVLITAQRIERVSRGATGLDIDIRETPQSISIVPREQMEKWGADNINDALRLAPGIRVEEWETNRSNYLSRGFEIKNTQVDGVGLPQNWGIVTGAIDAFGFEKLEVIRGANGLLTGVGNASGTINFVRKRPTNEAQGQMNLTAGSFNQMRVEADYSTPLTDSGAWAARVVASYEDGESHLRSLENDRSYIYGVIDGQLGDRTTLTMGYSYQDANTTGNLWGNLIFANSDGTQAEFPRNASTTQDWTRWDTINHNGFMELTYQLGEQWSLKGTYNYRKFSDISELFYVYTIAGLDPVTAEGLYGWAYNGFDDTETHLGDLALSGRFTAFGRDHEVMLGLAHGTSSDDLDYGPITLGECPTFCALPGFPYAGDLIPKPDFGPRTDYSTLNLELNRIYGATRLAITDRVKLLLGFNSIDYTRDGLDSFGVPFDQTERETSPYAGLTVDITDNLLAYASYSDIYQPQDQKDINQVYLDPSKGENLEVGLKAEWFDNRLLTTLAWFSADQLGLSTFAGIDANFNYYYVGVDVKSEGFELEAVGRLNDYVEMVFAFTSLDLEGEDGSDVYEWVPRETASLSLTSSLPAFTQVMLGLNARWQSDISTFQFPATIRQDSYTTLDLFGRWDVTEKLSMQVNVNNVTDEKYINTLYYSGNYSAQTNYSMTLGYRF
jgi:outer membrane receptor for ferric coprogen and ferric-rhodotorulic acid